MFGSRTSANATSISEIASLDVIQSTFDATLPLRHSLKECVRNKLDNGRCEFIRTMRINPHLHRILA